MARADLPPPRFVRSLGNAGAFLAAAIVVCAAINARLPTPPVLGLAEKFDYLAAHPEVDTVFIGSSRVFHAFDPRQFDREMAARGQPTRSFNCALDGLRPPESYYVLRELLKQPLPRRRIFIELVDLFPRVNVAHLCSARYHHWHDWRHTQLVLRQVQATREPLRAKVKQAAVHLLCFGIRTSNYGRGPEFVAPLLSGRGETPLNPWTENAGYAPQPTGEFAGPRRVAFEKMVSELESRDLERLQMPELCATVIREVVAEVRAAGAEPIFVLSPTVARGENFTDFAAAGIDAPLIAFNDPRRYPAIFRPENRCDHEHLNAAGAAEYNRALAEEFARLREMPGSAGVPPAVPGVPPGTSGVADRTSWQSARAGGAER